MKSQILITIDTEVSEAARTCDAPFERYVLGRVGEREHGAIWIAELLKSHGLVAEFFVDFCGAGLCREDLFRDLCRQLVSCGHGVQLHTHPGFMYDFRRRNMHEYTLSEQTKIIGEGISLLTNWARRTPIAHRAGNYGANADTLRALLTNGIHYDASFLFDRANCKLPFGCENKPIPFQNLWEIPVTVALVPTRKLGIQIPFRKHFLKLDINFMPYRILRKSLEELNGSVPYITIFLHSWSFIRRCKNPNTFKVAERALSDFRSLLEVISSQGMEMASFDRIAAELPAAAQPGAQEEALLA